MLKNLSLLMIVAGLALGPVYWIYMVHFTGQVARSVELRPGEGGAWSSPAFRLGPDMGPVGLILRLDGHFSPNMPDDQAPRDAYHAVLHQGDAAGPPIRLELSAGTVTNSNPRFRERLVLLRSPQAGEYRLEVAPTRTPQITLDTVQLEIRSHVRQTDNRVVAAGIALLALGVLLLLI